MAGAGVKEGQMIETTNKQGAYVTDRPITPDDMAATILHVLGIDPKTVLHTPLGRPVELTDGRPVAELF